MTTTRQRAAGGVSLLANLVLPLLLFYVLRQLGVGQVPALVASMIPPIVQAVHEAVRERRVEPLAMLILLGMVLGVVAALLSGSPRERLVRNAWLSAPLSLWTLASLRLAQQPVTFVATKAVLPHRASLMDRLWETDPGFRRAWRRITVMWGAVLVVDAGLRILVSYTLPVDVVPGVDPVLTVATILALQVPTHRFLVQSGHWHQLFGRRSR